MGSLDENDVLGYAGIPVNVNGSLPDFLYSVGAAGGVFLPPGRVLRLRRLRTRPLHGRSLAGRVHAALVGERREAARRSRCSRSQLSSGRPTIVARITDAKSGVDPLSLQLYFGPTGRQSSVAASFYDPSTGIAAFTIPRSADRLQPGPQFMQLVASDYQEGKNISAGDTSANPLPNTQIGGLRAVAVTGPR